MSLVTDALVGEANPKSDFYLVCRRLSAGGRVMERGEVVDASGWRNTAKLVEQRFLHSLPFGAEIGEPDGDGRRFLR